MVICSIKLSCKGQQRKGHTPAMSGAALCTCCFCVQSFGEIVNTKIMRDSATKVPRGFGFVLFAEADQASKAAVKMHEQVLNGKKLYVTIAQSKAARQQQLQDMMKNNMMAPNMGMPFPARGMNAMQGMPQAMQGMNMSYMPTYPGMMPYGMGRGQMMPNPMQYQMQGKRSMQNGNAKQSNATSGPVMMQGGVPMQFMPNMMGTGMMGPAGMMHPAMSGQRGGRGGRGGRGQGRGGQGQGPGGPGRIPGFVAGRNAGRGGHASRGAAMGAPPVAPMQMAPLEAQIPPAPQAEESNLAAKLANMSEQGQKQHLGELLFPRVQDKLTGRFGSENAMKLASKVTGMFLEMDTSGLLYLLDTETECSSKIEEALNVLRLHGAMPEGCA
jgi:polyadenylate-binding protein